MGLMDRIKEESKKAGTNKGKILMVGTGEKKRIRFLQELDDGMELKFHASYEKGVNALCGEEYGKSCPYCGDEDYKGKTMFAWSVYDTDEKQEKVMFYGVTRCTPVTQLVALSNAYKTIMDRDYVLSASGTKMDKQFQAIGMDKVKFRNDKVKAMSKSAILNVIKKAYPIDTDDIEEDDDDIEEKATLTKKNKSTDTDDKYDGLSAKKIYDICIEKGIDVPIRKEREYYIQEIQEFEKQHEKWGEDEDNEDEWEQ